MSLGLKLILGFVLTVLVNILLFNGASHLVIGHTIESIECIFFIVGALAGTIGSVIYVLLGLN